LLNNYYRGGSSSAFSNAVEAVEREAVSEMIGSFGALGWLDFEED
jgi:hypothetical protein